MAAVLCTFCEHPYLKPCNGKDGACMNRLWTIRAGRQPANTPEKAAPAAPTPSASIEDLL